MSMIKANFFWHGSRLSLYEAACISSFAAPGFAVNVYTFNKDLPVPSGVNIVDASKYAHPEEVFAYEQGGHKSSIAAFSDIFRYRVLAQEPGWWFDTDVYRLKEDNCFLELERQSAGMTVGFEDRDTANGAVVYIANRAIAQELGNRAQGKGRKFEWGAIGPQLLTEYMRSQPQVVSALSPSYFYPIDYHHLERLFLPSERIHCWQAVQPAVCVHLWNEHIRRWNVPKDILPCKDSFLMDLLAKQNMSVSPDASLPLDTFKTLALGRVEVTAIKLIRHVKELRNRFIIRSQTRR
jgi:hypothetical protein